MHSISTYQPERKVLLAIRANCLDPRLLNSALGLCQRLSADLEVLVMATGNEQSDSLAELIGRLREAQVVYSVTRLPQLRRRDIVQYANAHECISAVVIDSLAGWEPAARGRSLDPWAKLSCPLVTALPPTEKVST